ncbi:hypothetical protein ACOI1H_17985 [Loktanella sp. DJP18]|uniref:hypothetical protein n=1 Tax=Loktanella sp. DJP18 TaxID=3409788 RepID=UPI003BB4D7BA
MCQCRINRRAMLGLSGVAALPLLAGCDDVDLVSDETVEAMGLEAWADIRRSSPVAANDDLQEALNQVSTRLLQAANEVPDAWEVLVFRGPEMIGDCPAKHMTWHPIVANERNERSLDRVKTVRERPKLRVGRC